MRSSNDSDEMKKLARFVAKCFKTFSEYQLGSDGGKDFTDFVGELDQVAIAFVAYE